MKDGKRKAGRSIRAALQVLQHLLLMMAVIAVLVVTTGSTVVVQGLSGKESYSVHASDQ